MASRLEAGRRKKRRKFRGNADQAVGESLAARAIATMLMEKQLSNDDELFFSPASHRAYKISEKKFSKGEKRYVKRRVKRAGKKATITDRIKHSVGGGAVGGTIGAVAGGTGGMGLARFLSPKRQMAAVGIPALVGGGLGAVAGARHGYRQPERSAENAAKRSIVSKRLSKAGLSRFKDIV